MGNKVYLLPTDYVSSAIDAWSVMEEGGYSNPIALTVSLSVIYVFIKRIIRTKLIGVG